MERHQRNDYRVAALLALVVAVSITVWFLTSDRSRNQSVEPTLSHKEVLEPAVEPHQTREEKPHPIEPKSFAGSPQSDGLAYQVIDKLTREPLVGVTLFADEERLIPLTE
jgi:hypothetical protein